MNNVYVRISILKKFRDFFYNNKTFSFLNIGYDEIWNDEFLRLIIER